MSFFDKEQILQATDGGLEIICWLYPDAREVIGKTNRKFKVRENEKTPSATLKKLSDGNYVVTDFGGDAVPRNGILAYMEKFACDFATACQRIAEHFNIAASDGTLAKPVQAEIDARPATEEEQEGSWNFDLREEFKPFEIETIFAKHVREAFGEDRLVATLKKYGCSAVNFYSVTKNRKTTTIKATEEYPIFLFARGDFQKIYQPYSADKARRFMYHGAFDRNYINGLKQCEQAYNELLKMESINRIDDAEEAKEQKNGDGQRSPKLPEIIICSGERDALNVSALGYQVVWFNSETFKISGHQFKKLAEMAEKVYYLPDIDATGRREAHRLAFTYIDIHVIRLPLDLLQKRDRRGKPCKDARDYFEHFDQVSKNFLNLLKAALPYRFWDEIKQYNRNGDFTGYKYDVNNVHLYNFLAGCGFYRLRTLNKNDDDYYIQVQGNIVSQVRTQQIRDFVNGFLAERNYPVPLRNSFLRSTRMNETSLMNLPTTELDFSFSERGCQFMFFENVTWRITSDGIEELKAGTFDRYMWDEKVLPFKVERLEPLFTVSFDENNGNYTLELPPADQRPTLLQYIVNTCRMHWKIEEVGIEEVAPDGTRSLRKELTAEEHQETVHHIINRLYTLGYMMHRYKDDSRPWAVWALESKLTEEDESKGGSGKSIFINIPKFFQKVEVIPGRDPRITENKHMLENIDEHTDFVVVDDADRYLNINYFYPLITGDWNVNPKNTRSFTLPFAKAPKIGFSSNFPPRNADQSTNRRLLYTVFSDYYHNGPNDEFSDERSPYTEFKKNLFRDFTDKEWNEAINLVAQCLQFYLRWPEKINPPLGNVNKRNLKNIMGDGFQHWADVYFSYENEHLDQLVPRSQAFELAQKELNMKSLTPQGFIKKLMAWCQFHGYTLNPKLLQNKQGRVIRKVNDKATEMLYIQTKEQLNAAITDDLPF